MQKNHIIAFDLDGTLLNDNKEVSKQDLDTLSSLNKPNIIRIAATGRNYYSVQKVLNNNFPIDYLVFSSGAGIMEWTTKKIIFTKHINKVDIEKIINLIMPYKLNFTVNLPIPNNHHMLLYKNHYEAEDLINYTAFYKEFVKPLYLDELPELATQMIVLLNSKISLYSKLKEALLPLKTVLTTSPVNNSSMWMEVFNSEVSKSKGISWICNYLKLNNPHIFVIGNDFNDIDMLNYAHSSFVVSNAPKELKEKFNVTKSNNESGFSIAINKHYQTGL